MPDTPQIRRYFRRRQARGKSVFARILDTAMLLFLLFAALFLALRGRGLRTEHALPLSVVALLFFAVLLLIYRRASLARFIPREMDRLRRQLLQEKLVLIRAEEFARLCRAAAGEAEPLVFQRAEPLGADELLPLLKNARAQRTVCAGAGFTEAAKTLAGRMEKSVRLIDGEALIDAAMRDAALRPGVEEVYAAIEKELLAQKARRRLARALPAAGGSCKKYLIAAALLLLCSFLTRYALYYRMLAGLCATIASARFLLERSAHTPPPF